MWKEICLQMNERGHLENNLWYTLNIGLLLFNQFLGFHTDKLQKLFSQRSLCSDIQAETDGPYLKETDYVFKNKVICRKSSTDKEYSRECLAGHREVSMGLGHLRRKRWCPGLTFSRPAPPYWLS